MPVLPADLQQVLDRSVVAYTTTSSFVFTADVPARLFGDTAVVVGTVAQVGTAQGEPYDGRYRVTLVLSRHREWRIVGIHMSLREPPEST